MIINVLTDEVINQIAAGEVVERPASVVRELVDNAIDAGADDITIHLLEGGQSSIRVTDNGCGMDAGDAELAFERHATSKIREASDLLKIKTMGFRGEALSSIAAVSKVKLRTRHKESALCIEVRLEGGNVLDKKEVPGPQGTEIEVNALFFNTPARRKFLKSAKNEELRVKQWLINSALCHPRVRYRLFSDGKEIVNFPRKENAVERASDLIKGQSLPFDYSAGPCRVFGVIAHPSQAESGSQSLVTAVNGRVITDKMVLKAARDGFGGVLKDREYPLGFIHVSLPPGEVDVNVHPQKSEVRFASSQGVFLAVRNAVADAINGFRGPVGNAFSSASLQFPERAAQGKALTVGYAPDAERKPDPASLSLFSREEAQPGDVFVGEPVTGYPVSSFRFSELRYIGQILSCYLVCEYMQSMYVVDMHAAHERINYNRILNSINGKPAESQKLLLPLEVTLSPGAMVNFSEQQEMLEKVGFELQAEGALVRVLSVPALLAGRDTASLIREVASIPFEADGRSAVQDRIQAVAARLACHASVRGGDKLNREEAYALFSQLDRTEYSSACPHGRPVLVSFAEKDIEKWFGRDR